MTAVVIILILLGILLLSPLGARVKYTDDETALTVRFGWIKIKILPKKEKPGKKKKKKKKKKKPAEPKPEAEEDKEKKKKKKRPLSFWLQLAKIGLGSVKIFLRGIVIDHLRATVTVADADASKTAVNYGKICAVIGSIEEFVKNFKRVKEFEVKTRADFFEDKMKFEVDAELSFLLYSIFGMAFCFVFAFCRMIIKEKIADLRLRREL